MSKTISFRQKTQLYCVNCDCSSPLEVVSTKFSAYTYQCSCCKKVYQEVEGIPCFLSSKDEDSEIFQKYFDNYSKIASDDIVEDIMPITYKNIQADKLIKYCGAKIKKNVLDIGSGKGFFLQRISHNQKLGIDISLEYLKVLQNQGIEGVLVNAEQLPFKECFDVIVLNDILEHVFNPEKVLQQVLVALKDKGIAVIRVPYKEDISIYLAENGCKYEFVHLRTFDESNLTEIIQNSGLKLKKIHYDGFSWSKIRRNIQHPLMRWAIQKIDEYVNTEIYTKGRNIIDIDAGFNKLPNYLGCIFFEPIECVAIAQKIK
jgi:SAM-dependent methyltransferase